MLIHNPNGWDYHLGINGPDIRQVAGSKAMTSAEIYPQVYLRRMCHTEKNRFAMQFLRYSTLDRQADMAISLFRRR